MLREESKTGKKVSKSAKSAACKSGTKACASLPNTLKEEKRQDIFLPVYVCLARLEV